MTYISHNKSVFTDKTPLVTNVEKGRVVSSTWQMLHSRLHASQGLQRASFQHHCELDTCLSSHTASGDRDIKEDGHRADPS